ncbi:16S rRNA (adenine(1518)-N(6)/adenine(1519)-N(6))-dimethyltransferase RsmA [Pelagibacteraceae bacterium]|nr:16S rRNA (adenine(1518)-N(6)/adenine(1519)-N(6))-dimethyltransferase RsmA [Pelagibacteraceae bacterium]
MKFAKKSLGQNFLIDKNIIKKIISLIKIKNKNIIEIGPGKGALTEEILKNKPKLLSIIEKDSIFAEKLKYKFKKIDNVKIYNQDVLKFNIEDIVKQNSAILGNLPYNISSQILVKILKFKKWPPNFTDLVLMFQKELGDKIIGKYQSSNYGRLSILSNYRLELISKFLVSANCFFPKPKVTSLVIHFKPKKIKSFNIKNIDNLEKLTNVFFSNKRKMINKNIRKILNDNEIKQIPEINLSSRPSEIAPDTYYKLTELYEKK